MWIVVDWADTQFIGPFDNTQEAEEWLVSKGVEDYQHQEFSIHHIQMPSLAKIRVE